MPVDNQFRHQQYPVQDQPPIDVEVAAVRPDEFPRIDVAATLRALGVARIVLVHGTFVGGDPFGLVDKLERFGRVMPRFLSPVLRRLPTADALRRINDAATTYAIGDVANYTDEYVRQLQQAVGEGIRVERFVWSSENNHIARAEATVRLLCRLAESGRIERTVLFGHSHAGNVFALLSNLLANHPESVERFLRIGDLCSPGGTDWQQAREILARTDACTPHPLADALHFVTFGTPIRYGWDTRGYAGLLHFNNHRPSEGLPAFRTKSPFPQSVNEILGGEYGDWVQALGIAGTNILSVDSSRRKADFELAQFLERNLFPAEASGIGARFQRLPQRVKGELHELLQLWARWKAGLRVPADGNKAFLFDYGRGPHDTKMFGHGVYTRCEWLPFHISHVTNSLAAVADAKLGGGD